MGAKVPTNGFLRMVNGDTFTAQTPNKEFSIQGLLWAGATGAGHHATLVDANGVTFCYLSAVGNGDHTELNSNYWGVARPILTPITAAMSSGMITIIV